MDYYWDGVEGGLKEPYAPAPAYNSGMLSVSDVHSIYFEESGNKDGNPVVFVHGGPGGGISDSDKIYFDPKAYRIIIFDQRGAGKSTPHAHLEDNHTWALVEDIEKLRKHLGIDKWVVFGGSWGSTLSLTYAEEHPDKVKALILRGIFTLRREELVWFYQQGASYLFPDIWEEYIAPIPEVERGDLMSAYYRRLTGNDESEKLKCAAAWSKWETSTSKLIFDKSYAEKAEDPKWALAFARIECHYFVNGGFFKSPEHVLDNAHKLNGIPGVIIQGRYDVVCPAKSAWELSKKWKDGKLTIVGNAGHSATETSIRSKLIEACEKFKNC
eukprot:Nk52_evm16s360 gene=Nk52_evmTU16s360